MWQDLEQYSPGSPFQLSLPIWAQAGFAQRALVCPPLDAFRQELEQYSPAWPFQLGLPARAQAGLAHNAFGWLGWPDIEASRQDLPQYSPAWPFQLGLPCLAQSGLAHSAITWWPVLAHFSLQLVEVPKVKSHCNKQGLTFVGPCQKLEGRHRGSDCIKQRARPREQRRWQGVPLTLALGLA